MVVASSDSCCTPFMLSFSSGTGSGAVSLTVNNVMELPSRLSKNILLPVLVMMRSHEYTDDLTHMSAVSRASVVKTRALSSDAKRLQLTHGNLMYF